MKTRGSIVAFLPGMLGVLAACSSPDRATTIMAARSDLLRPPVGLRPVAPELAEPNDDEKLYTLKVRGGEVVMTIADPPPIEYGFAAPFEAKADTMPAAVEEHKLHRSLEDELASAAVTGTASRRIAVGITFKETLLLPRMPNLRPETRESAANRAIIARRQALIDKVLEARGIDQTQRAAELTVRHGARVLETFGITNTIGVELPLAEVRAVAARPDVQFIEPLGIVSPLPSGQMINVRNLIGSDNVGGPVGGSGIGLLDSGVRASHTLLSGHLGALKDCAGGDSNCNGGDPSDHCQHGTASAAELTANGNLGNANRGNTGMSVDSWRITTWSGGLSCGTPSTAVLRAFAKAPEIDGLLVVEAQDLSSDTGMIASAADTAFAMGVSTIAVAGNNGVDGNGFPAPGSVTAPGNARKALAVGAVDVTTQVRQDYSGLGPTADGRTKPDIMAPTNVTTAGIASDTDVSFVFGGTSAANPNGAGLAAQIWNVWGRPASPGRLYAAMIALGNNPSSFNNEVGAGLVNWIQGTELRTGSTTVTSSDVEISFAVTGCFPCTQIDGAIWWPESPGSQNHNDIDLSIVNPSGTVVMSSTSISGVFEKVRAGSNVTNGTWKLRIKRYQMKTTSQVVYYAFRPVYAV